MCALCLIGMAALSAAQEGMAGEDEDVVHLFGEELESSEAESSSSEQEEGTSAHDACTTCGEVDEFFPQYCSRHPSFAHAASSFAPCSGNVELCGRCFDAKLKMSCVKCQRWDCHECQAFDKDDGNIGMDFTSNVYATDPKLCRMCSNIFCKECSFRCERCLACVCTNCAPKNYFFMCCDKCLELANLNPGHFPFGREEVLCRRCASSDKNDLGYIRCPVVGCTEMIEHEADLASEPTLSTEATAKRKNAKSGADGGADGGVKKAYKKSSSSSSS